MAPFNKSEKNYHSGNLEIIFCVYPYSLSSQNTLMIIAGSTIHIPIKIMAICHFPFKSQL